MSTMAYDYYNKLETKLFYEREGKIKRQLATMVEKDKLGRPPKFYYKRQEFKCNIANASAFQTIFVEDSDDKIINELEKLIKIQEQKLLFKQLFTKAVMKVTSSSYGIKYLLGEVDGEYLTDEAKVDIDVYSQDNPEFLKQFRRLKLMAGTV